jgi:hypothetical protein
MNNRNGTSILSFAAAFCLAISANAQAEAIAKYELTIANGLQMPISPAAIYVKGGGESAAPVGSIPSTGFIQLCQTGNTMMRLRELKSDASVKFVTETTAPILPGESRSIEIQVMNPQQQSIHFETMYGKTKDVCGVVTLNSHSLVALKHHVTGEIIQKDNTILTGAFIDPVVPVGTTYPDVDDEFCPESMNAVSCLRELSLPKPGQASVRFFAGYFPSLIGALEMKYGASEVQTLLFPASGAIQAKLKLKH